jgi:3',5'-cyclic AMP phosphodiesterase CpdA
MGENVDTPLVMVRFRDSDNVNTVAEHSQLIDLYGNVTWGLWLKQFEDEGDIIARLEKLAGSLGQIYIADTTHKSKPVVYVASVSRVITDNALVDPERVPSYYRDKLKEIPIWFELSGKLMKVNVDDRLVDVIGVPTIYFLEYENGRVKNISPQREFVKTGAGDGAYVLHLTDIHLGEDHGFRPIGTKVRTDVGSQLTLPEALKNDLNRLGFDGKIAAVVISGDIVTKGGWERLYPSGDEEVSGLQAAQKFLSEMSDVLSVPPDLFFLVPGNHDIVRQVSSPADVTNFLIDYKHESGFRALRENFCSIYKLAPLNYVVKLEVGSRKVVLGLLNSAYLNDQVGFSEYGFVGDDAEGVFEILNRADGYSKILVLHHHVLPVYEHEVLAKDNKVSLTLDAASIMRRSQEVGVEVVLHGHQHAAKLMDFASWSAQMEGKFKSMQKRIRVVAGGSSGAKSERLPGDESNTYGLLDITGPNLDLRLRRIYPGGRLGEDW